MASGWGVPLLSNVSSNFLEEILGRYFLLKRDRGGKMAARLWLIFFLSLLWQTVFLLSLVAKYLAEFLIAGSRNILQNIHWDLLKFSGARKYSSRSSDTDKDSIYSSLNPSWMQKEKKSKQKSKYIPVELETVRDEQDYMFHAVYLLFLHSI